MATQNSNFKANNIFIYIILYVSIYSALMAWKYFSGDEVTWISSFVFLAGITAFYLILKSIGTKKSNQKKTGKR